MIVFVLVFVIVSNAAAIPLLPLVDLTESKDTLVLLHALFRHGNRTPDKASVYPTDPYSNYSYAPYGYSQLTLKGKQTEYNIGTYIRETYKDFIPQQYGPDVIYALSTNTKRTKMSLELVLAGLFPPDLTEAVNPNLGWQPIPFNIEDEAGFIATASIYCTNYINTYYSYVLSQEGQNTIAEYQDLYARLSKNAGCSVTNPLDVYNIYATLQSQNDLGLKLPEWTSDIFPETLEDVSAVSFELAAATQDLQVFASGLLLKQIIEDSLAKKNGTLPEDRKLFLYSAHDMNVATMLKTLNVYYRHIPPYGATLFFEIHNILGQYGLKLYYQDYTQDTPKLLTIPGCTSFCPLEQLVNLVQDKVPNTMDICNVKGELM